MNFAGQLNIGSKMKPFNLDALLLFFLAGVFLSPMVMVVGFRDQTDGNNC